MPRQIRRGQSFRTATALAASVSLLVPGFALPVAAQDAGDITADCTAEFSTDAEGLANCVTDRTAQALEQTQSDADAAAAQAEADAAAAVAAEAQAEADASVEAEADAEVQAQADAAAAAAQEAADKAQAEADEAAQAQADAEAAAQAQAEADAEAEAEAQAEADAAAAEEAAAEEADRAAAEAEAAEAEAAEQAQAEAEAAEAEAAEQAQADADAAEQAQAEAELEANLKAEADAAAAAEEADRAAAQAEADATAKADAEAKAEAAATAPENGNGAAVETQAAEGENGAEALQSQEAASADANAAPVMDETPLIVSAPAESAIAAEVAARPEPVLNAEQEEAREQAEMALGALSDNNADATPVAAAAAQEGEADNVEVAEETIQASDVRTSSEEFETQATVSAESTATAEDEDRFDRNDKILLGALGALAVGAILVNNNNRSRVVSNSGDRVVVQREDGNLQILKDDDVLLRQAGSNVRTERFDDGSTRQTVLREDGSSVVTIRDASLRVLRRELVQADGSRYLLIDDTAKVEPVDVEHLPDPIVSTRSVTTNGTDPLRDALARERGLDRRFSLAQVRNIPQVRALAPAFEVNTVTFASGSAAIAPEQAANLSGLAREVVAAIEANPREVFLIEGHTDAVGDAAYNLALSDRRAESLALALNEYFNVPVENMVIQGYGEQFLKVQTQTDERANRRATVRQITDLLQTAAAN
ncbi:OmpA family protein [Jannaschia helgolandensis]|uniref:Outer membrane protein OmpA n=1 Tax=Jannaschia helgolandensis TaxID=188906 RepID=A0A1H7MFP1_9RHOB|nr:OmpA family protein [Jannaschia helgolandensis]SEL09992.1 Outer membrane protein OmpA [Jannaschia helgolandensis]